MTRLLLFCVVAVWLVPTRTDAQFDEVGIFFGISHYSGDLTERKLEPLEFNRAWGIYVRKKMTDRFSMKYQFTKGLLSGKDGNATVESALWRRNLSFETDIYELSAIAEYYFFRLKKGEYGISPYVYGGLAGFYFTPYAEVGGKTYDLRYYRTEGIEYSSYQFAIPFGAGVKIQVNGMGSLGIEAGLRKTFTDYLDDVSGYYPSDLIGFVDGESMNLRTQLSYRTPEVVADAPELPKPGGRRGNPENNDWYLFFGVTLGVNLK
ncbi:MAG: DUF6089 family protein [Bacteroidota bacterium]